MKKPDLGGGRATSKAVSKIKPNTHQALVLQALHERPMSAAELQWALPIADARAVVRDLIAKGCRIEKHKHPRAEGRPIQRYHLITEG
ncbi:helix-turn-helix domain-containing protein [Halomonas urumqiensis]|nr:helix-turn-helix domain-containing protein [Halomonas urumqiensis]